jgi:nicotinamidase-related amidase
MMHDWETQLTPADRELYERRLYGTRQQFRSRPALLIVDVTRSFVGSRRMPLLEAIEEYPTSCGERGWDALPQIRALLDAGRRAGVPVIYTRAADFLRPFAASTTKSENPEAQYTDEHAQDFPELTAPQSGELVIDKAKASAFFGTPLETCLRHLGVDSLIVAGTTTSGCVRASVVDAHSHGFTVFVVEECCFDRFESAHRANLFDMNAKYATVIGLPEAIDYLDELVKPA